MSSNNSLHDTRASSKAAAAEATKTTAEELELVKAKQKMLETQMKAAKLQSERDAAAAKLKAERETDALNLKFQQDLQRIEKEEQRDQRKRKAESEREDKLQQQKIAAAKAETKAVQDQEDIRAKGRAAQAQATALQIQSQAAIANSGAAPQAATAAPAPAKEDANQTLLLQSIQSLVSAVKEGSKPAAGTEVTKLIQQAVKDLSNPQSNPTTNVSITTEAINAEGGIQEAFKVISAQASNLAEAQQIIRAYFDQSKAAKSNSLLQKLDELISSSEKNGKSLKEEFGAKVVDFVKKIQIKHGRHTYWCSICNVQGNHSTERCFKRTNPAHPPFFNGGFPGPGAGPRGGPSQPQAQRPRH